MDERAKLVRNGPSPSVRNAGTDEDNNKGAEMPHERDKYFQTYREEAMRDAIGGALIGATIGSMLGIAIFGIGYLVATWIF